MSPVEQATESLKRSEGPLSADKILESMPPPVGVEAGTLEQWLREDGRISVWPALKARAGERFWIRSPSDAVLGLVADNTLSASEIQKNLNQQYGGFKGAPGKALVMSVLDGLLGARKVYQYPGRGRKYSAHPADAAPYVGKLRKSLDALLKSLETAGVTRDAILSALRDEDHTEDPRPRILAELRAARGSMGIPELRERTAPGSKNKDPFDQAVLSLWRQRQVYLDRHHFAQGLSEEERNQLVADGAGNYYVMISLREADAESVP